MIPLRRALHTVFSLYSPSTKQSSQILLSRSFSAKNAASVSNGFKDWIFWTRSYVLGGIGGSLGPKMGGTGAEDAWLEAVRLSQEVTRVRNRVIAAGVVSAASFVAAAFLPMEQVVLLAATATPAVAAGLYVRSRYMINPYEVYRMALAKLSTSSPVVEIMGEPLMGTDVGSFLMFRGESVSKIEELMPSGESGVPSNYSIMRRPGLMEVAEVSVQGGRALLSVEVYKRKGQVYGVANVTLESSSLCHDNSRQSSKEIDVRAYVLSGGFPRLKDLKLTFGGRRCFIIFPVKGPEKRGLVYVEVTKKEGRYDMKLLGVEVPVASDLGHSAFLGGDEQEFKVGGLLLSELVAAAVRAVASNEPDYLFSR